MPRTTDAQYQEAACQRLQMSWQQALEATEHLPVRQAGQQLGVPRRLVSAERIRLGLGRRGPREQMHRERQQLAAQHGFDDWDQVLTATMECSAEQVGQAFGLSADTVREDRIRFGVREPQLRGRPFDPADPADRLHGSFGYRRGCRCLKCRRGWARASQVMRQHSAEHPSPSTHAHGVSGYTNHRCRCQVCKSAWRQYRADYARRKAAA